jgi:hypothetical protein
MKTCVFCGTSINRKFYVCRDHLSDYYANKDTAWFKELLRMELKQEQINSVECFTLVPELILDRHKISGREIKPTKTETIIKMYREGKSEKTIQKETGYSVRIIRYALKTIGIKAKFEKAKQKNT